jgi:CBS domain-containing protein
MKASIFSITKVNQNNIDYLNIDLTEGISGDSFSFKLKEGQAMSEDFLENFEASYIAWQSLSSDTRMPWSPSLINELTSQVDRFNNYQHYIADIHVSDIMSKDPHTFSPTTTILEAAQSIIDLRISGAPVVDDENNLVGIVSEKDILSALFEETMTNSGKVSKTGALEVKSMSYTIDKIMIKNVLSANLNDEITPALSIMQDNNLRRMPVVGDSKLIGIISIGDIHRAIFKSCIK